MTTTLHPACPLCGLRFGSRPLLDLHIREDHRQRDPGRARVPAPRPGSASDSFNPPRTTKEVTAVTAVTATRRPRRGSTMPRPRRVIHALRYVNGELTRAFEAIIRSARAAHSGPRAQAPGARPRAEAAESRPRAEAAESRPRGRATADASRDTAAGRAGRAA